MTAIIILFALGIAFILLEVIIPGGILGGIGALMLFAGCVMSFLEHGSSGGMAVTAIAFTIGGIMIWIEFKILPKTRIGKRAFLTSQVEGVSSAFGKEEEALVGKSAEAVTTLSPSGYVRIDGQRYEAFCQSGFAEAGTPLKVIGVDNFRLIVSHSQPNPSTS